MNEDSDELVAQSFVRLFAELAILHHKLSVLYWQLERDEKDALWRATDSCLLSIEQDAKQLMRALKALDHSLPQDFDAFLQASSISPRGYSDSIRALQEMRNDHKQVQRDAGFVLLLVGEFLTDVQRGAVQRVHDNNRECADALVIFLPDSDATH